MSTIAERLRQKRNGNPRVIFNVMKKEIDQALSEGNTVKAIYEDLFSRNVMQCTYRTFLRYVEAERNLKKKLTPDRGVSTKQITAVDQKTISQTPAEQSQASTNAGEIRDFVFTIHSKEDLV
ncbi:TraK family protein [Azospirillum sp. SYSU D00513]|uniref:TraK family protein n=1 Tax=Azospirillum sp. SYSU D00513 TaxID=2812561 RepID=UPI001A964CC7|nr:TraK family protein [Azospirillum sp. SYSU D00513]